jgi:hypothetical protein
VTTGDAIYAIGGTGVGGPVQAVERFDGTRWAEETTLPGEGLNAPAAAGFDPATDRWTEAARLSRAKGSVAAVVFGGKTVAFGGRSGSFDFGGESQAQGKTLDGVLRLTSVKRTWKRVSKMPAARNYARAVLLGDAVYVVGGSRVAGDSHSSPGSALVNRYFVRR